MEHEKIDYQLVLADLEEKKAKIQAAIEGIRAMLGHTGQGSPVANGKPIREDEIPSDAFFGMSIVEATKKYLRMARGKRSTPEIVQALEQGGITHTSKNFTNTVYAGLFRDWKAGGEIVRVGHDWGLAEWYPNMRKSGRIKPKTLEELQEEEKPEESEGDSSS